MKRTVTRLADGRELIYFDETRRVARGRPDPRDLPPPPPASQLRYDPLLDEWVAIAAHRQTRTFLPPADECPLCPSTRGPADRDPRRRTTTWSSSRTGSRRSPPRRPGRTAADAARR